MVSFYEKTEKRCIQGQEGIVKTGFVKYNRYEEK